MKFYVIAFILLTCFASAFAGEQTIQLPENIQVSCFKELRKHQGKQEFSYHFSVGPVTISAFPRGKISMQCPHISLGSVGVSRQARVSFEAAAVKAISNGRYTTFAQTPSSPKYMASVYKALERRFATQSKSLNHWLELEKYHTENPDAEVHC